MSLSIRHGGSGKSGGEDKRGVKPKDIGITPWKFRPYAVEKLGVTPSLIGDLKIVQNVQIVDSLGGNPS